MNGPSAENLAAAFGYEPEEVWGDMPSLPYNLEVAHRRLDEADLVAPKTAGPGYDGAEGKSIEDIVDRLWESL